MTPSGDGCHCDRCPRGAHLTRLRVGQRIGGLEAGWRLCSDQRVQVRYLDAGHRTGEEVHGPAGLEDLRARGMHIVKDEDALAEGRNEAVELRDRRCTGGAGQAVEQALLIPLGLELTDEPGARVGKSLVIHVHRVLRGEEQAQAKGTGLLEHTQQRPLGRRVGSGREVAVYLIHIEDGTEGTRAGLRAHPSLDGGEEQSQEEHALTVVQVGEIEDAMAGPTVLSEQTARGHRAAGLRAMTQRRGRRGYC